MSDIPSADKASIITELLVIQNNLLDGNVAYDISDKGDACIAHGDNQQAILEQVFSDSYNIDDLHGVIGNVVHYADNIDGDLNTTSILMLPHIEEIQKLTSEQPIDHSALFKEVATLGVVGQTSELMNSVSGMVDSEDRNDSDIAQFNANLQAMCVIAMNIAQENGVNIPKAVNELQQGIESKAPEKKLSLRPIRKLSADEKTAFFNNLRARYGDTEPDTNLNGHNNNFFSEAGKHLDNLSSWNGVMDRFIFSGSPFGDDIKEEVESAIQALKTEVKEFERSEFVRDLRGSLLENQPLQEKLLDTLRLGRKNDESGLSKADTITERLSDFRKYVTALHEYHRQHDTLVGAEKLLDLESSQTMNAVEQGMVTPSVAEGELPMVMTTSFKSPSPV